MCSLSAVNIGVNQDLILFVYLVLWSAVRLLQIQLQHGRGVVQQSYLLDNLLH